MERGKYHRTGRGPEPRRFHRGLDPGLATDPGEVSRATRRLDEGQQIPPCEEDRYRGGDPLDPGIALARVLFSHTRQTCLASPSVAGACPPVTSHLWPPVRPSAARK